MNTSLFRSKAMSHQLARLRVKFFIVRPPKMLFLIGLVILLVAVIICYLFVEGSAYKRPASDDLFSTQAIVKIYSPKFGTILEKHVEEGEDVKQGDALVTIFSERIATTAPETLTAMLEELKQRRENLRQEQEKLQEIDILTIAGIAGQIKNLKTEIRQAETRLMLQSNRFASTQRTVDRYEALLKEGFVSETVIQEEYEQLIHQRNQLTQLKHSITSLNRELSATKVKLNAFNLKRENNAAAIERQISELERQLTELEARRRYYSNVTHKWNSYNYSG